MRKPDSYNRRYRGKFIHGELRCGDATGFLRSLPKATADLIFLDPPFNLRKDYGAISDSMPEAEYQGWLEGIVLDALQVLAPGGSLYLYHLPKWSIKLAPLIEKHLTFRHWIAVSMKNGFVRGNRLYPAHYALLYFTKGAPSHFNRPRIKPALCRKCGVTVRDYGGYRPLVEANGLNLSDIWDDLSPVRHSSTKHRAANELPRTLTDRVIAISGSSGGRMVDPFAGSGAMVVSAAAAGMHFLANDLVKDNCLLVEKRLAALALTSSRKPANVAHR